ncbi:MAG: hypothetical protein IPK52_18335 [Chloroflexi bacterium]|nr:hypothetical protein [Chloroflexota bacterium]
MHSLSRSGFAEGENGQAARDIAVVDQLEQFSRAHSLLTASTQVVEDVKPTFLNLLEALVEGGREAPGLKSGAEVIDRVGDSRKDDFIAALLPGHCR